MRRLHGDPDFLSCRCQKGALKKQNSPFFRFLQHDGEKHCIMQDEILAIMGERAAVFDREIPKSRSSGEASYPRLYTGGELQVPREASRLCRRQLNELLINTPFYRRTPTPRSPPRQCRSRCVAGSGSNSRSHLVAAGALRNLGAAAVLMLCALTSSSTAPHHWRALLRCDPRLASRARWRAPPRRGRAGWSGSAHRLPTQASHVP